MLAFRRFGVLCRDRADSTLAEIFCLDAQRVIEARAVIFPGNSGGKFNQLGLRESFTKTGEKSVGDFHRSARHRVGIFEDEPFDVIEIGIRSVIGKTCDLLGSNSACSAHGRADVNSKRAADQRRDTELSQSFQLGIDQFAHQLGLLHLAISP